MGDGFATVPDHEPPMFSAGLSSASIDWSHYDGLDFNNDNFATSSYSQAPSFTGSDFDTSDFGDIDGYRLSTASSYIGMPQAQMLASNNFESLDLDSFLKGVQTSGPYVTSNHGLPTANYMEDGKSGHNTSPFDDATNFQLLPTEEENDVFWQSFVPGQIPSTQAHSNIPENNNWAQ